MGWLDNPVVENPAPAPAPSAPAEEWLSNPVVTTVGQQPRIGKGIADALSAGYQSSGTGLALRGRLPDIELDPTHAKWYERLASGVATVGAEIPQGIAGALLTAPAGPIASGAGAFALPAMIRQVYVDAYTKGEVTSSADFLNRAKIMLKQGAVEGAIGGLTVGAGKVATVGAGSLGLGKVATEAASLTAQAGALTVAPAALEGRLPEPQDFMDAAILLVGLKGATAAAGKIASIYRATGKTPIEVAAEAKADPTIAKDLAKPSPKEDAAPELPRAYQEQAKAENARNAVPDPSPEAERFVDSPISKIPQLPGEPVLKTHVNYNYLNTTEDVKGALSRLSGLYEAKMKEATRGEVSWEKTYAEAKEMFKTGTGEPIPEQTLANADYAKLSADLYARKQILQSGAEQLMSQQKAYTEARANGTATDAMKIELLAQVDRVAQAQAAIRGSQAEVGRALNILKSTNRDKAYYDELKTVLDGRFGVKGTATGDAHFDKMVDMLGTMGTPAEALKFAAKASRATTWDKIVEGWKAGLVSGPITQMANIMGNASFLALRPLVDATAVVVGKINRNPDAVRAVEPLARIMGNLIGVKAGLKAAWGVLKTGEMPDKAETHVKANPGVTGEAIRSPFRALGAADAIFRTLNEQGEGFALASRQATKEGHNPATREFYSRVSSILADPPEKMLAQMKEFGVRGSLNAPLGAGGKAVQKMVKTLRLEWLMPFIQTPINSFKENLRMLPAAPLVPEWRQAFNEGGAARDKAIAEVIVGAGISAFVMSEFFAGNITGQLDPDPKKRATQMAAGIQPYSIKIGNTWYSYQRLQPLGTLVGMAADVANAWEYTEEGERDKLPKILAFAFANSVTNQTFLQGITNFSNVLSDPDRYGSAFFEGLAGSLVPGIVGQTAQLTDPYQREVYSMLDAIQNRIPIARENLPPRRDPYGQPVETKERLLGFDAVTLSRESSDKVRTEAARLGVGASKAPGFIELPAGKDRKLGKLELTPEQRDVFADKAGTAAYDILNTLVNSPSWDQMPDMLQKNLMERVFQDTKQLGKMEAVPIEQILQKSEEINKELQRRLQQKTLSE